MPSPPTAPAALPPCHTTSSTASIEPHAPLLLPQTLPASPFLQLPPTPRAPTATRIDTDLPPTPPPRAQSLRVLAVRTFGALRAVACHFGFFGKQARFGKRRVRRLLAVVPFFVVVLWVGRWASRRGVAWTEDKGDDGELMMRIARGEEEIRRLREELGELRARVEGRQGGGVVREVGDGNGGDGEEKETLFEEDQAEELKISRIEAQVEREEYLARLGKRVPDQEGAIVEEQVSEEHVKARERQEEARAIKKASEILRRDFVRSSWESKQKKIIAASENTLGSGEMSAGVNAQSQRFNEKKAEAETSKERSEDLQRVPTKTDEYRRAYNLHRARVQMERARAVEKGREGHGVVVEGETVGMPAKSVAGYVGEGGVQAETEAGESHQEGAREGENSFLTKKAELADVKGKSEGIGEGDIHQEVQTEELIELRGESAGSAEDALHKKVGEVDVEKKAAAEKEENVVLKGDE